jgi:glycosyltransferase involved in cell wall biosynthesis
MLAMLSILDHAWHQVHSYRLHALPARFEYFSVGPRGWEAGIRPVPENFGGFVENPQLEGYDVVMSHLDNWCDAADLRGTPFRVMSLLALGAPQAARVCIMHGSPSNRANRERIVEMLASAPGGAPFLVCNSRQACAEWGLGAERSRAIIHGYRVDEFWSSEDRKRWAITVCSAGQVSWRYHGVPMLLRVKRDVPVLWCGYSGDLPYFEQYADYREFLANSLIYVHCGKESPMPGARTEAMLSGCCVVSTSNHDADRYIEHGVSGFLCDSAEEMIETIRMLLGNPEKAYRVGVRGREAAREFFNHERYVADWLRLLGDLGVRDAD